MPRWLAAFTLAVTLIACAQPPSTLIVTLPPPRVATVLPVTTLAPALTPTASPRTEPPTLTPFPSATIEPSPTPSGEVRLMAVGDLMLGRTIGEQILAQGPQIVFASVQATFDSADLLVGNLECALSVRGQPAPKAYTFAAPPLAADALAGAGFDVLSLANNHALDYGPEALADTQQLLDERGIVYMGAGADEATAHRPVFVERNGLRLAFLAYVNVLVENGGFDTRNWAATADSPGVAWAQADRIRADVAAARAQADVVIVLLHSGYEGRLAPSPNQRQEAQAAIEGGAALVLGAHPHVLQPVEHYQDGLIVYSLGNFVFDDFGFPANYTAIFSATLTVDGVRDFNWIPAIVEAGLPRLATPDEASRVLAMLGQ